MADDATNDQTGGLTVFAVYMADTPGPVNNDDGICSTCVALFGDVEDAITEASDRLRDGYSVSIDIGFMTHAEWEAIEEVPNDFVFASSSSSDSAAVLRGDDPTEDV